MKARYVVTMMLALITLMCHAEIFEAEGLWFETTSDETVTLIVKPSGGGMFITKNVYQGDIVVPETITCQDRTYTVTAIKDDAFTESPDLTSVTIPATVLSMGDSPFLACPKLSTVTVADGNPAFIVVDGMLFNHDVTTLLTCPATTVGEVTVPDQVTTVNRGAFYDCTKVTAIDLPSTVSDIGSVTFFHCDRLADIVFPEGVTALADSLMFYCTSLKSVSFPQSLKTIGKRTFYQCSKLTRLDLPGSLEEIGEYAFSICYGVNSVTLPACLRKIGYRAFENCSKIKRITLPASVENVAIQVFVGCNDLRSIEVADENPFFCSDDGVLFDKEKTTLICCPSGRIDDEYVVPSSVTTIGEYGFYYCRLIDKITLPFGLRELRTGAFRLCSKLKTVVLPPLVSTLGEEVFNSCSGLKSILCYASPVPQVAAKPFTNSNLSVPLYVPAASLEDYQSADKWLSFSTILPLSAEVVDGMMGDTNDDGNVTVFDVLQTVNVLLGIPVVNYHWQRGDMNFDGLFTVTDVISIVNKVVGDATPAGE